MDFLMAPYLASYFSFNIQGGSNMTGTDLCVNKPQSVPVIFEPPCSNDVPTIIPDICNPFLFADDTSMIITNSGFQVFKKDIHSIIIQLNRWFKSHLLSLNLDKTHFPQFLTKNSCEIDLQTFYENKFLKSIIPNC